jgi:hypothetical protein
MTASEKWDDYLKVGDRRDVDMGTALRIVADLAAAEKENAQLRRIIDKRASGTDLLTEQLRARAEKAEAELDGYKNAYEIEKAHNFRHKDEVADLTLRLAQKHWALEELQDHDCSGSCDGKEEHMRVMHVVNAALSTPPGELVQEVREALKYYANDGLYVQMVVDGVASPAGAKAREVLAKMGGEK